MAITPGAGYMVDPNNPNAVIPIGSQSTINNPNAGYQFSGGSTPTPAAQQPPVPTPQPTTPPAPTVTINNAPQSQPTQTQSAPQPTAQNALSMPPTGSVVDLLNAAGQKSDYASRQQLAQQYGIQGYQGTAAQNQELSKKFLEAFNAKKSTPVPQTSADARGQMNQYFQDNPQQAQEDPQKTFFDQYMAMNPVMKTFYDQITNALSSTATQQSFKDEFAQLQTEQGIPALNTELLNIKNIMDGTEDDIRTEITKAGGFATDSQVQALTGARNKTLLKQANMLQQQLIAKEDYVDHLMQFSKLDREQVSKDLDRKLGLTEKLADIQDKITSAAKDNYQKVVDKVGYNGLAQALAGDKTGLALAEQSLGLPKGILSNPTALKALTSVDDDNFQFVSGTDNQASGVFDKTTGKFTRLGGGGGAGGGGIMGTVGSATNADGTPKTPIQRDADSVMAGVLNLQDISTKDNYRAQVSAELNTRFNQALASGDIYGVMKASAAYDKEPGDTFITSMEKLTTTLGQIDVLQENIKGTNTGPITGLFRGANPWDTNAQAIKAQLNAIVPNLARGVYGEVGVLTDNDIKNYSKTLPNLTSTEDVRNAVLYITVDMIRRNAESKIKNQAAGQRDMSGYADVYKGLVDETAKIKSSITGGTRKGTITVDGVKVQVTQLPNGDIIDAAGNKYDQQGNKIKAGANSSIPWNSLQVTR